LVADFTCSVAMLLLLELDLFETDRRGSTAITCIVQTIVRENQVILALSVQQLVRI
jgi:hypothetical protein